jgi:hypothetical protein
MNKILKNKMSNTAKKIMLMLTFALGAGVGAFVTVSRPVRAQVAGTPYIVPSAAAHCDVFPFDNLDFIIPLPGAGFGLGSDPGINGQKPINLPNLKPGTYILIAAGTTHDFSSNTVLTTVSQGLGQNAVIYGSSKLVQFQNGTLYPSVNYRSVRLLWQWAQSSVHHQASNLTQASKGAFAVHIDSPVTPGIYTSNNFYVSGVRSNGGSFVNNSADIVNHMVWIYLGADSGKSLYNSL